MWALEAIYSIKASHPFLSPFPGLPDWSSHKTSSLFIHSKNRLLIFSALSLSGRPPPPTVPLGPNETPSIRPEILGLLLPPWLRDTCPSFTPQ